MFILRNWESVMSNSNLEEVREAFGTSFEQYCERHGILPVKTKCGAFRLPDTNVLKECIDYLDECKNRLNEELDEIQRYRPVPNFSNLYSHGQRPNKQYGTKKGWQKSEKTREQHSVANPFLAILHLEICLYDTPSTLPSHAISSVPDDYILNTAKSGKEMYEFVLKKTIENTIITDYEASIFPVSSLLEQFQKRHKKFHYYSVLKHLTQKTEPGQILRCKYEVSRKQLESFFALVLYKVVPSQLFGKSKNVKKIKKAMFAFLNTPCYKAFNLKPFIEKLDISSIGWLMPIGNKKTQWLIIAKFMKWFFNGFLIKVLHTQFHVTSLSASNKERLYIRRSDWCYVQKKFIRKKMRSDVLQPDVKSKEWNPPVGMYKLIPKSSGIRPIFISKYEESDKRDINMVLKFLRQLYITEFGLPVFHEQWKSIVQQKCDSGSQKFCLISCDVTDAFGSIIQEDLYGIIHSLCEKLPKALAFRYYGMKSREYKYSDTVCYKQYFSDINLKLPMSPGTLYACADYMGCQWMQKSWLLDKVRKYIFHQRVKIRKNIYIIGKGVVQGMMLSPVLSDIYYSFMLQKEMMSFTKSGVMIRYMDDILYVTEIEDSAKQFFQVTRKGIPRYNCRFKELKTQSNVSCNGNTTVNSISYIGYKIDCNTLEVKPEIPSTNIHLFISFSIKNNLTPLQFFRKKLYNISPLKLSKFVLDSAINSKTTMTKILKESSLLQAKRASILILELFENMKENAWNILRVIKSSNRKIPKYVIRSFLANGEKMDKSTMYMWYKKIIRILWASYKHIFQQNKILRRNFVTICRSNKN